jgi:hypothetical protein
MESRDLDVGAGEVGRHDAARIAPARDSVGTRMEFEILNTGRAPAWTKRYTVAPDTRRRAATSRTVSS